MESRLAMKGRTRIGDEGSITALVVILTATFVACAGLAVDGGRLVAAKIELGDQAENAARVGAQEIASFRGGSLQLDEFQAVRAAEEFLAASGVNGDAYIEDNSVTVDVWREVPMTLLRIFGVKEKTLSARRSATPTDGL